MAEAALAGETLQAFPLSPPAPTDTNTPELARLLTAVLTADEKPPPTDMLATAGFTRFKRTQSTPAMTPAVVPEPVQLSTRTPCSRTWLATPYAVAPMIPATWVPWPLQSAPLPP